MKSRSILAALLFSGMVGLIACGGSESNNTETSDNANATTNAAEGNEVHGTEIKPGDVQITYPLNQEWIAAGKGIYDMKCQSCHKLTDERLVGPGWKGVTQRRKPEWI